jgi:protein NrfD
MDVYVTSPQWEGYIIWYFFLGGIAAGSYAVAALAEVFGDEADRRGVRGAYYMAFPLICVCGLLLTVDLGRPERFWHMLIESETFRPMFKWWSPMSVGSWGLTVFGAFSSASFLGVLAEDGRLGLGPREKVAKLRRGLPGRVFALAGAGSAFFLGSYTGALLSATNQPIWANTTWLAPLFLASATSTGVAALILMIRWRFRDVSQELVDRLERTDTWAMVLEMGMLLAMAFSLGRLVVPAFGRWPGLLVPAFVLPVGLFLPLIVRKVAGARGVSWASLMILLGGFVLRAAIVGIPDSLLAKGP